LLGMMHMLGDDVRRISKKRSSIRRKALC